MKTRSRDCVLSHRLFEANGTKHCKKSQISCTADSERCRDKEDDLRYCFKAHVRSSAQIKGIDVTDVQAKCVTDLFMGTVGVLK